MKDKVLIYHKDCPDGYSSRWVFEKKFGNSMEYIPASHGSKPPSLAGKEVYIADFAYDKETTLKIKEEALSLIILDHHKTAQENLISIPDCFFDMTHCGCVISWKYCFPDCEIPLFLKYIEDQDLWNWSLPHAKEILSFIDSFEYSKESWDLMNDRIEFDFDNCILLGELLLKQRKKNIHDIVKRAFKINVMGNEVYAVNTAILQSDCAQELVDKFDCKFSLAYYFDGTKYRFSIRTTKEKNFDVSEIAVRFGGGGHKTASGFSLTEFKELLE